jgi:uncharacterized membrane protein YphA (DoxX/SURF4 family)
MKSIVPALARVFISAIFISSGFGKITGFAGTKEYMASAGMPLPGLFLVGAIVLLLVGGFSILLGYKAQWGAVLLIVFLVPATVIFHPVWNDPGQKIAFMKNLGLLGGLLMVFAYGAGAWALDKKIKLK